VTFKPSKLPQLVVAYEAHFGKQVPTEALRILQPVDLVGLIQKAIDTNTPLAETDWYRASPMGFFFSPRGCCIIEDESATPAKLPSGE
jgi:hypothetical protein